jgi:hypothetical protein
MPGSRKERTFFHYTQLIRKDRSQETTHQAIKSLVAANKVIVATQIPQMHRLSRFAFPVFSFPLRKRALP